MRILKTISISCNIRFLKLIVTSFCFLSVYQVNAQTYFQQKVEYEIKVILDNIDNALIGEITIHYTNSSGDTLNEIYFHLWPNAYKNNQTAFAKQQLNFGNTDFYFSNDKEKGYIDSLGFTVNGVACNHQLLTNYIDIAILNLKNKLLPGESIQISTPFYVKIPAHFSRLGYENNTYYITQWYPKPAVYNKYGWHEMPYLDQGEFYSEFAHFKVDIFVPQKYIVAATGNKTIPKYLEGDIDPFLKKYNYIHHKKKSFTEENVIDFAWFASNNFVLQEKTIILPVNQQKVKLSAFHLNGINKGEENVLQFVEDAIIFYSNKCFPYPYETCKVVIADADGGMEYPTITVVGSTINELDFESVVIHEIGHNWFYNIIGSNERNEPWIDEGFNTFYEYYYFQKKYSTADYQRHYNDIGSRLAGLNEITFADYMKAFYQIQARENKELPLNLSSEDYDEDNYYSNIYFKTALGINMLKNQIGEEKFDSIMHNFFQKWKFKHPALKDVEFHFREKSGVDVNWFFNDFLTSTQKSDYKIQKVKHNNLYIKNTKKLNAPVTIRFEDNNQFFDTTIYSTKQSFSIPITNFTFSKVQIDPDNASIDLNQRNNNYNSKQLFNKADPIKMKLLGVNEKPGTYQINFVPSVIWNNYDKLSPGLVFYNSFLPSHVFEYFIFPTYGTSSKKITGTSFFQYHLSSNLNLFHSIELKLGYSSYSIDHNIEPYSKLQFNPEFYLTRQTNLNKSFSINYFYLNNPLELVSGNNKLKHIVQFSYKYESGNVIKNQKIKATVEGGKGFVKSFIEAKYMWKYPNKTNLKLRLFAGKFLYETDSYYGDYNFRLAGWTGIQDYTYSNVFLGRSEIPGQDSLGILERQFVPADGGFTTYTYLGQTNDWLIASNLKYKPPIFIPLQPYLNFGLISSKNFLPDSNPFFWETGIEFSIIPDIFGIYFPVFMSENIETQSNFISENYWDKIRFTINMNINEPYLFVKSLY